MAKYSPLEFWTHVRRYEGMYMVSTLGRVMSLISGEEKILKPWLTRLGYLQVGLYLEGERKHLVHRLVAEAFLENWDENLTVNHRNYVKTDNRVENLELMSRSQNSSNQNKEGRTSRYLGVSWNKRDKNWRAHIKRDGKPFHIGYFDDEKKTAVARDKYVIDHGWEKDYQMNNNISDDEE